MVAHDAVRTLPCNRLSEMRSSCDVSARDISRCLYTNTLPRFGIQSFKSLDTEDSTKTRLPLSDVSSKRLLLTALAYTFLAQRTSSKTICLLADKFCCKDMDGEACSLAHLGALFPGICHYDGVSLAILRWLRSQEANYLATYKSLSIAISLRTR